MGNRKRTGRSLEAAELAVPVEALDAEIAELEPGDAVLLLEYRRRILDGLATDWQDPQPGVRGPRFRVIAADGTPTLLVRELLPEGTELFEDVPEAEAEVAAEPATETEEFEEVESAREGTEDVEGKEDRQTEDDDEPSPEELRAQNLVAWHEQGKPREQVPPYLEVVGLDELAERATCIACPNPGCDGEHPLIEEYLQTGGTPSKATWLKRRVVLCEDRVYLIGTEEGNTRS